MKRGVIASAIVLERLCPPDTHYRVLITPTYRPGVVWHPRQVSYLIKRMRHFLERRGITPRYVWVLELTRAGNPHYHLCVWMPKGEMLPKPDEAGWWPHGSTRIEKAHRPIGYLAKYVSKGTDGVLPKGARLWGCGGLERDGRAELRWKMLPNYVRRETEIGEHCIRFRGVGGWVSLRTGQWWPPPVLRVVDGRIIFEEQPCSTPGTLQAAVSRI